MEECLSAERRPESTAARLTVPAAIAAFRRKAERTALQPAFDPRSYIVYAIVATMLAAELAAIALTDFRLSAGAFLPLFGIFLWMAMSGLLARRYGHPRIALFLEVLSLPTLLGGLTAAGSSLLAAISGPFVDHALSAADAAIGFDWLALFRFYQRHDWVTDLSRVAYTSLFLQLAVLPCLMVYREQRSLAWTFVTAWALASLMAVCAFPFFPAFGPYLLHGIEPGDLPRLYRTFPWEFGPSISGLRSGAIRDLGHGTGGLISLPSFHGAAAFILGICWLRQGVRATALVLLNIAMFFASLVSGAHYLVDMLGGAALGVIALILAHRFVERRDGANRQVGA